jgi:hypothetical protein
MGGISDTDKEDEYAAVNSYVKRIVMANDDIDCDG